MDNKDIRDAGLKVTHPRVRILAVLEENEQHHLSAEDVYKILLKSSEEIGLATVYRVLNQFEQAGLVERHHFEGGSSVYELSRGDHHDHIVCIDCNRVEEFVNESIEHAQHQIAQKMGFELADHSMVLYGKCTKMNCPYLKSTRL